METVSASHIGMGRGDIQEGYGAWAFVCLFTFGLDSHRTEALQMIYE